MYIDFDTLPDHARVWVYQADRRFSDEETRTIHALLEPALRQWAAHGQPLLASAQIIDNRFVVVGVDEGYNLPSGCSIDASVRTLRTIGAQLGIDFFDRSAVVQGANGTAVAYPLASIKGAVADGHITPNTLVYNTLVKTKAEFMADWHLLAANSWLKRYFKPIIA